MLKTHALPSFPDEGCRGHLVLTGSPGWLISHPGAGQWAVEAGSQCTWTITAPNGHYIALNTNHIWLNCHNNWQTLNIYDGADITDVKLVTVRYVFCVTCTVLNFDCKCIGRTNTITITYH